MTFFKKHAIWVIPLLIVILITPFTPFLDLVISKYFYNESTQEFWVGPLPDFFYKFGELPATIMGLIAAIIYLASFFRSSWKKARKPALILILTLVIGAGVIVNGIFKDHWGRPRPKQITEFGGPESFFPYYIPNFGNAKHYKSFPCGHCTMGFYFLTLCLIGYRYRISTLYYLGLIIGLGLGITLSFIRIAQGGHFFSDVMLSALIMWIIPLLIIWVVTEE